MKPYLKKTSLLVLLHFLISLSTPLSPVWASQNPTGFKSASNGNFTVGCVNEGAGNPPNCSQCTNFCSDLDGNGISGSSTWNTTDDALCSDVGAPTSGGTFVTMPTPLPSYSNCTVNITAQVLTAVTTSPRWAGSTGDPCVEAQKLKDMCTFHNSQVQVQCQAVDALTGGSGPNANGVDPRAANLALMSMDFIIAALCTSAALVPIPALTLVCSGSAMAEGAAELGTTMQMLSGKTQDYLSVAFGGLGIAEGVGGTALSLKNGGFEKAKNWIEEASKDDANQKAEKISRGTSAVTAATFAALAGIRLANVIQMNSALSDACNAVNSLLGSANPPSSGNNNPSGNASNGPTASGGTQLG